MELERRIGASARWSVVVDEVADSCIYSRACRPSSPTAVLTAEGKMNATLDFPGANQYFEACMSLVPRSDSRFWYLMYMRPTISLDKASMGNPMVPHRVVQAILLARRMT
jgi:hypothetical protein